jgi:hypothetical protein
MNKSSAMFADVGTTGWGLDGDSEDAGADPTEHMSVTDLRQQQQRMIQGVFCIILHTYIHMFIRSSDFSQHYCFRNMEHVGISVAIM